MAAYDAKAEKNQFPKMLYQGTTSKTVENADAEAAARDEGWGDTPSGRIQPKSHSTASPTVQSPGDDSRWKGMDARIDALDARLKAIEAMVEPEPAPAKKGK